MIHNEIVLLCALLTSIGATIALALTSLMSRFPKVCDVQEGQDPSSFGIRSACPGLQNAHSTIIGSCEATWLEGDESVTRSV